MVSLLVMLICSSGQSIFDGFAGYDNYEEEKSTKNNNHNKTDISKTNISTKINKKKEIFQKISLPQPEKLYSTWSIFLNSKTGYKIKSLRSVYSILSIILLLINICFVIFLEKYYGLNDLIISSIKIQEKDNNNKKIGFIAIFICGLFVIISIISFIYDCSILIPSGCLLAVSSIFYLFHFLKYINDNENIETILLNGKKIEDCESVDILKLFFKNNFSFRYFEVFGILTTIPFFVLFLIIGKKIEVIIFAFIGIFIYYFSKKNGCFFVFISIMVFFIGKIANGLSIFLLSMIVIMCIFLFPKISNIIQWINAHKDEVSSLTERVTKITDMACSAVNVNIKTK